MIEFKDHFAGRTNILRGPYVVQACTSGNIDDLLLSQHDSALWPGQYTLITLSKLAVAVS